MAAAADWSVGILSRRLIGPFRWGFFWSVRKSLRVCWSIAASFGVHAVLLPFCALPLLGPLSGFVMIGLVSIFGVLISQSQSQYCNTKSIPSPI